MGGLKRQRPLYIVNRNYFALQNCYMNTCSWFYVAAKLHLATMCPLANHIREF